MVSEAIVLSRDQVAPTLVIKDLQSSVAVPLERWDVIDREGCGGFG